MDGHYDVVIAGAGISGIAAAHHLQERCPERTFTILEARDAIGGTWDLFRFPGIRSDSDMFTLGFSFRPWPERERIGDGESIRKYLVDTATEAGLDDKIRFGTRIERVRFSTADRQWTVEARQVATGERRTFTCNFFFSCMGYYRYDKGHMPDFAGIERFHGEVIHPQHWPEELDYADKRVVVIGSGATAMTMVPVVAKQAARVTMVQRSPTYVVAWPRADWIADLLRAVFGKRVAHGMIRWKNTRLMATMYGFMRRFPRLARWMLLRQARNRLGKDYDVDTHFTPRYNPWDERLCLVPDGDLFDAIREGPAEVVTGQIDTFTERGLRLRSGEEVEADIIVTATGFDLQWMGGVPIEVDGAPFNPASSMIYKGSMLAGLPNAAFIFGYINSSWTLRAELVCKFVCEVLRWMDAHDFQQCCPEPDPTVDRMPPLELSAGYVKRSEGSLPAQGSRDPWRFHQNYRKDRKLLLDNPIDDGVLRFSGRVAALPESTAPEPLLAE